VSETPTPQRLYVHDDLTEAAAETGHAPVIRLTAALFAAMRREPHVVVITLAEQLDGVLAHGGHPPFATTIGIGRAGERVATALHERAGWFPRITRIDVTREEDGRGGYVLAAPVPLAQQLVGVPPHGGVAVVDDTIFSGLTLRGVLGALPDDVRRRTRVFCLRAVAESLRSISSLCPVTAGLAAPGRMLHDVSFINASGLVRRGSIRRVGGAPLAFFERPEWMGAWFPRYADDVTRLCRQLCVLLDGAAPRSRGDARAVSSRP
jgi:hypothetical protein